MIDFPFQKLIADTVSTESLSIKMSQDYLPEIGELTATLANLPNQITLKDEQDEVSLVLIPQEGNCVTITVSKTRFELKIDIRFAKTFENFENIYFHSTSRNLVTDFRNQIDQIKHIF